METKKFIFLDQCTDHTYVRETSGRYVLEDDEEAENYVSTVKPNSVLPLQIAAPKPLIKVIGTANESNVEASDRSSETQEIKKQDHGKLSYSQSSIKTHTGKQFHLCSLCNKAFSSEVIFREHVRSHGDQGNPLQCTLCGKSFVKRFNLKRHLMRIHSVEGKDGFIVSESPSTPDVTFSYPGSFCPRAHDLEKKPISYSCDVCHKVFSKRAYLRQHLHVHSGQQHHCSLCEKAFSSKKGLWVHMLAHKGEKPHQCPTCEKRFATKPVLLRHLLLHEEERRFQCDVCKKKFRWKSDLKKHSWLHSEQRPHVCSMCNRGFIEKKNFTKHLLTHSGEEFGNLRFGRKEDEYALNHIPEMHVHQEPGDTAPEPPDTIEEDSSVCSDRLWMPDDGVGQAENFPVDLPSPAMMDLSRSSVVQLVVPNPVLSDIVYVLKEETFDHLLPIQTEQSIDEQKQFEPIEETQKPSTDQEMLTEAEGNKSTFAEISTETVKKQKAVHSQGRVFQCDVCKLKLSSKANMNRHRLLHTGEKPLKCTHCGEAFRQIGTLNVHVLRKHKHTDMPFRCTKCPKTFPVYSVLRLHMLRVHTNEKPHKCPHCNNSYASELFLRDHYRRSLCNKIGTPKAFQCTICKNSFHFQRHLSRHMMIHNRPQHPCNLCSKLFRTKYQLKRHLLTHSKPHQCAICDKTFSGKWRLERHVRLHTKPYQCLLCGRNFPEESRLNEHTMSHDKETVPRV